MKNNFFRILMIVFMVILSGVLTGCGDVILDEDQVISNELPPRNTPVAPTTLPSNQTPTTPANDNTGRAPLFVSQAITRVVEGKLYSYSVKVDDPDFGDQLTIAAPKLPSWLELTKKDNNTVLIGTPENKHIGGHLVELVVTDSTNLQSKQFFYVYVLDQETANSAPQASDTNLSTQEDKAVAIVLKAEDIDGDTLNYTITKQPTLGKLSGQAPQLSYQPNLNASGEDSFKFIVSDGRTESQEAVVSLRIIALNDAPIATEKSVTTPKNTAIEVLLPAQDVETSSLTYSIVNKPAHGTLSTLYGNKLSYTPNQNYLGNDSFSFKASDGQFASNVAKISIKVGESVVQPPPPTNPEPQSSKYRVIVSTEVGLDPDDIQSLYRLVHYSDIFDIEGIVASRGLTQAYYEPRVAMLKTALQNIRVDSLRAKGYTELTDQATLLSQVKVGRATIGAPKTGTSSEGSNHIISQVKAAQKRGDTRPLWVLVWGPLTDVAQALHDDPSISPFIRIYSIGSVNSSMAIESRNFVFDFVRNTDRNLFWIDNSSVGDRGFRTATTYQGTFLGGNQSGEWAAQNFVNANIRGHGPTGEAFPLAQPALKEGDSPTLLYLMSPIFGGVGNVDNPTSESWGGSYKRYDNAYPNYYIDCCTTQEAAQQSISKWRVQHLSHWKARWDRYIE